MGIQGFQSVISSNLLKAPSLNDSTVVIDAHNFFYTIYELLEIPYAYGWESDRLARCLKECLMPFKLANTNCYFVFKGGNTDIEHYFTRKTDKLSGLYYVPGTENFVCPLFCGKVIREVLNEMKFKYVTCVYEAKNTCIALAQYLSCSVVSFDYKFSLSNINYIPLPLNKYTIKNIKKKMECGVFNLNSFLNNKEMTIDEFTLFIVLADDLIFPVYYFKDFFTKIGSPLIGYEKNNYLLRWISQNNCNSAVNQILESNVDKKMFFDAIARVKSSLIENLDGGLPLQCILGKVEINKLDPEWFEKGVALHHVDETYINLYKSKTIPFSEIIQDFTQTNAIIPSVEIIKYAFDLMTDFKGGEITIRYFQDQKQPLKIDVSSPKPNYECQSCVFENGWEGIKSLNLFEHFVIDTLESFDFNLLKSAPDDARLLIIALVYFSRQKDKSTGNETLSILMSYVLLNVVSGHTNDVSINNDRHILDSSLADNHILSSDCRTAMDSLESFFIANIKKDFDYKMIHPLSEFQHCLQELNKLNRLCGEPYKPTIFNKTYNGTFVYNFLLYLRDNEGIKAINCMLDGSITVLAHFNSLWRIFTQFEPIYIVENE